MRSHGSPASSPANLSFGPLPQQERSTKPHDSSGEHKWNDHCGCELLLVSANAEAL